MGQNYVHAVNAKRVALLPGQFGQALDAFGNRLLFPFAFLEGRKIIQQVVAYLFQIIRDIRVGVFFFQLLDNTIDQDGRRFLLQITQLAGHFAGEGERLAIHDGKFLAKLLVLALDFFGDGVFQLAFLHHLGNILDGHHLAFKNRKNFRQSHRANLHMTESELVTGNAPREIIHQFFFAYRIAFDDSSLLPLKRFAFENLGNAAAQEINSGLHFFFENVSGAAGQRKQAGTIGKLEIIYVATIQGGFGGRM